jgi:protein required for attachment to host cells
METIRIPNLGWVIVGDGRKALFLRNDGTPAAPKFSTVSSCDAPANPRTSELGTDRPGRVVNSVDGRRSGVEQPDYHDERERAFARKTAEEIGVLCAAKATKWVALIAAPRTLAVWRQYLPENARSKIAAELPKDLTKHPLSDITTILTGISGPAAA